MKCVKKSHRLFINCTISWKVLDPSDGFKKFKMAELQTWGTGLCKLMYVYIIGRYNTTCGRVRVKCHLLTFLTQTSTSFFVMI